MTLVELLKKYKDELILEANDVLNSKGLKNYKKSGKSINVLRLKSLYESILNAVEKQNMLSVIQYAEKIASERFNSGYEIYEVQTAFNALEEVIWKKIILILESNQVADGLRAVSTIMGAGKESLANSYVGFSRSTKTPAINQKALFEGTDGS